jgi:DNA ligase (NAD+)
MAIERTKEYYESLILRWACDSFEMEPPEAVKKLDGCIKKIALLNSLKYADVYDSIYSLGGLSSCLVTKGPLPITQKACEEDCRYVWYNGRCYPRFFPDSEEMNRDPDAYVAKHIKTTKELESLVEIASYLYYNYEGGGITDNTFDGFEYILKKRFKQQNLRYEKIGAPPVEKIRTKLPYPMGSLDKIKPSQTGIIPYISKPVLRWSQKLDGVSALVVYGLDQIKVYTRGDGIIGGDVSFITSYVKFPSPQEIIDAGFGLVAVRGELIMSVQNFEKYSKTYANPRSMVSSKANSGYVTQGLEDMEFVAYQIVDAQFDSGLDEYAVLEASGFKVVTNGIIENPTVFDLAETYKSNRASSLYRIDGLVISTRDGSLPTVAFKMPLEAQVRWSKIINIEWNVSRYGKLIPTAVYESVYVDGTRLHRATAHSARKVEDWKLKPGAEVRIIKSGDIIPTITQVISTGPADFPPENYEGGWAWKGAHIVLKDPESNPKVHVKRWSNFFEIVGVPRLREKTLEKLQLAGFSTLKSIVRATPDQLKKAHGIGDKKSTQFYTDIHSSLSAVRLDRLVIASGLVEGIGRKLIRTVTEPLPNIFELSGTEIETSLKTKKVRGIGPARIKQFSEGIPKVMSFFFELSPEDCKKAIETERVRLQYVKKMEKNPYVNNKSFAFTGFWGNVDYDLEDYILDNGGSIESEVNEDCAAVIIANILVPSEKAKIAKEKGIPVLTLEEFYQRFNIPQGVRKGSLQAFVRSAD